MSRELPRRGPRASAGYKLRRLVAAAKTQLSRVFFDPSDLGSQLEDLFVEVLRQEQFERMHPITCAAIRETRAQSDV